MTIVTGNDFGKATENILPKLSIKVYKSLNEI